MSEKVLFQKCKNIARVQYTQISQNRLVQVSDLSFFGARGRCPIFLFSALGEKGLFENVSFMLSGHAFLRLF